MNSDSLGNPSYSPLNVYPSVDTFTGGFANPFANSGLSPHSGLGKLTLNAMVMQPGYVSNPYAEQQAQQLIPELDSTINTSSNILNDVSNTHYYTGVSSGYVPDSDPLQTFAANPFFTHTQYGTHLGSPSPTGGFQSPMLGNPIG